MSLNDEFEFPDEIEEKKAAGGEVSTNESDDFEIEIVDDTPAQDRGRKPLEREVADPSEDEIESYSEGVKKRIKELTHARHDERRAKEAILREKEELERVTQQLIDDNKRLKQTVHSGTEQYMSQAKTLAETELEAAKRKYKEAHESFDADAMVEAQAAMMAAQMKMVEANKFRQTPLQEREVEVQTTHREPQRVQPDEKTLRWQAKNQWFGAPGYEEVTSYALGLHQKLVNTGVSPTSEAYFEQIDARMKSKFPEILGADEDKPRTGDVSKKPATVVAGATRSTGAKKIQLTSTQVALAKKFGLTPQQYAAELAKMEKSNG
jgi:hypothetical protein